MKKTMGHFEQIPVEIVKKIAQLDALDDDVIDDDLVPVDGVVNEIRKAGFASVIPISRARLQPVLKHRKGL